MAVDCYVTGRSAADRPADQGSWKQTELKPNAGFVCDHGCCNAVLLQLERATAGRGCSNQQLLALRVKT